LRVGRPGAAGGSELVKGAGTMGLTVFSKRKVSGDLASAEARGDQVEDFEFPCGDDEGCWRAVLERRSRAGASAGCRDCPQTTVSPIAREA